MRLRDVQDEEILRIIDLMYKDEYSFKYDVPENFLEEEKLWDWKRYDVPSILRKYEEFLTWKKVRYYWHPIKTMFRDGIYGQSFPEDIGKCYIYVAGYCFLNHWINGRWEVVSVPENFDEYVNPQSLVENASLLDAFQKSCAVCGDFRNYYVSDVFLFWRNSLEIIEAQKKTLIEKDKDFTLKYLQSLIEAGFFYKEEDCPGVEIVNHCDSDGHPMDMLILYEGMLFQGKTMFFVMGMQFTKSWNEKIWRCTFVPDKYEWLKEYFLDENNVITNKDVLYELNNIRFWIPQKKRSYITYVNGYCWSHKIDVNNVYWGVVYKDDTGERESVVLPNLMSLANLLSEVTDIEEEY